jgi:hypothetical protein
MIIFLMTSIIFNINVDMHIEITIEKIMQNISKIISSKILVPVNMYKLWLFYKGKLDKSSFSPK